jgi:hypothetical protein
MANRWCIRCGRATRHFRSSDPGLNDLYFVATSDPSKSDPRFRNWDFFRDWLVWRRLARLTLLVWWSADLILHPWRCLECENERAKVRRDE